MLLRILLAMAVYVHICVCICVWCVHSYIMAMPQCLPARSPAGWKPESPMRATVGVMVRGPMYCSSNPGSPSAPMHTSIREDTMMAPWIWEEGGAVNVLVCFFPSYPGVPVPLFHLALSPPPLLSLALYLLLSRSSLSSPLSSS